MSMQDDIVTSQPVTQDPAPSGHPILARAIIAGAVLMFFAMMALIMYRWLTVPEPTSLLLVAGTAADAGAIVEVSAADSPDVHRLVLGVDNNYTVKFPLPPGTYRVHVAKASHGEVTFNTTLREGSGAALDLSTLPEPEKKPTR